MKARTCFLPVLGERVDKYQCTINIPHGFELGEKDGTFGLVRNGTQLPKADWRGHEVTPSTEELRYENAARSDDELCYGSKPDPRNPPHESAREELGALHRIQEAVAREWGREIMAESPANEIVVRVVIEDRRNG